MSLDGRRLASGRDFNSLGELRGSNGDDKDEESLVEEDATSFLEDEVGEESEGSDESSNRVRGRGQSLWLDDASASEFCAALTNAASQKDTDKTTMSQARWRVGAVNRKESTRHAPRALTTSTLQQEANKLFKLGAADTMRAAQRLYEAGVITCSPYYLYLSLSLKRQLILVMKLHISTLFFPYSRYMRTDNAAMSVTATAAAVAQVAATFGDIFVSPAAQAAVASAAAAASAADAAAAATVTTIITAETSTSTPKRAKADKSAVKAVEGAKPLFAQEAHEAIRPVLRTTAGVAIFPHPDEVVSLHL